MAANQSILLKKTIRRIKEFTFDMSPTGIEWYFLLLNDADQSADIDLWNELRAVLASNSKLQHQEVMSFLDRPYFAKEGNWWWDSHQWKVPLK